MIVEKRTVAERTRESDAFLKLIGMCVVSVAKVSEDDDDDSADAANITVSMSMKAIHRQIFASLSHGSIYPLLKAAGDKRKQFEEEELAKFRCVELEEIRWKYSGTKLKP